MIRQLKKAIENIQPTISSLEGRFLAFARLERIIAALCIFIPLILRLTDNVRNEGEDAWGFEPSLSDYVYENNAHLFGMLLAIAGMTFIFNGVLYNKQQTETKQRRDMNFSEELRKIAKELKARRWYNIAMGSALLVVVMTPHEAYPMLHYVSAGTFILVGAYALFFHFVEGYKLLSRIGAAIILIAVIPAFLIPNFPLSILFAEWIALIAIAIYYIAISRQAIDEFDEGTMLNQNNLLLILLIFVK